MNTALVEPADAVDTAKRTMSVLLADDHPLILAGIRRSLEDEDDIDIVGEAHSGPQLLAMVDRRDPDVVVMDIHMPGMDGVALIVNLRERSTDLKIVVLSAFDDRRMIDDALRAGASAYVVKRVRTADIAALLRQVVGGAVFVGPPAPSADRDPSVPATGGLSPRERAVLTLVATGLTTTQISRELWISEHTTKFHLTNIYRKLGVTNRAGAVRVALEAGLAPLRLSGPPRL
jgi:DNA-binding NarL/FixJ family response regulator